MINPKELPIIFRIRLLHKDIYQIGEKLNKRDKLGIHKEIENLSIQCLSLAFDTAFRSSQTKFDGAVGFCPICWGIKHSLLKSA